MSRFEISTIEDEMVEYTEEHSLSHEDKMELAEETTDEFRMEPWEVEDAFNEVGAPICQKPDGELFLPEGEVGRGTSTYTSKNACREMGGERVGQFHTHPTPPITPSNPDLRVMQNNEDQIACIGSIYDDDVVVACFEEPEEGQGAESLEMKRFMASEGMGGGGRLMTGGEKVGEINIWEDTKPTPREILEKYPTIIEQASDHTDTPKEEIETALKEGRIHESIHELWTAYPRQNEHEEVDLPVYSSESEEEMLERDKQELKTSFKNVTIIED